MIPDENGHRIKVDVRCVHVNSVVNDAYQQVNTWTGAIVVEAEVMLPAKPLSTLRKRIFNGKKQFYSRFSEGAFLLSNINKKVKCHSYLAQTEKHDRALLLDADQGALNHIWNIALYYGN